MKTPHLLPLLAFNVLFTGCVPFYFGEVHCVPVPSFAPKQIEQGRELTAAQTAFIVPGQTTRAEVVARLGNDFRDSPRLRALAYSWQYNGVQLHTGWSLGLFWGFDSEDSVRDFGWRALLVAFDRDDRVLASGIHSLNAGHSLDEQLEGWAQGHGAASTIGNPAGNSK